MTWIDPKTGRPKADKPKTRNWMGAAFCALIAVSVSLWLVYFVRFGWEEVIPMTAGLGIGFALHHVIKRERP